jgi:SAM-dependent methyltransferase
VTLQSPVETAHHFWKTLLTAGDTVIDATCGNGKDTLILSKLVAPTGKVYAIDIQQEALDRTQLLLSEHLTPQERLQITLLHQSHVTFPHADNVKLIVYNLGYLPRGDKTLTTQTSTTLISLSKALDLIPAGGAISITCYPGHPEGAREEEAILKLVTALPSHLWNVCYHEWINRLLSPSLILVQKRAS